MHLNRHSDVLASLVSAEIKRQRLGRDIHFEVMVQPVQNPDNNDLLMVWSVVLTMPSPLLGRPLLIAVAQASGVAPDGDSVRKMVADGINALDNVLKEVLSIADGAPRN